MSQRPSLKSVGKNEWAFSYPRLYDKAEDYFIEGLNELESNNIKESRSKFKQALSVFPQHIDVLHHLSVIAENPEEAKRFNDMAIEIGISVFPKKFDITPSISYGEALSYFKKGDIEKATKKLKSCTKYTPLCAKILLEDKPKKPRSSIPGYITFGGADQAYEFWKTQGQAKAWQEEKVKQWLRKNT